MSRIGERPPYPGGRVPEPEEVYRAGPGFVPEWVRGRLLVVEEVLRIRPEDDRPDLAIRVRARGHIKDEVVSSSGWDVVKVSP